MSGPPADRKFFFIHVMKTAGGTLRRQILANFEREQVYPMKRLDPDMRDANYRLDYLTSLPPIGGKRSGSSPGISRSSRWSCSAWS